jgi:hypothetical protein
MPDHDIYLIWSHEHGAWWRPNRCGYAQRLSEAGRYSRAEALLICTRAIPGTAAREGALPELPVALADVMAMLRGPDGAEYEPSNEPWE